MLKDCEVILKYINELKMKNRSNTYDFDPSKEAAYDEIIDFIMEVKREEDT